MDLDEEESQKDIFENPLIVQFSIDHCLEIKSFLWTQFLLQIFTEKGIEVPIDIKALSEIVEVFSHQWGTKPKNKSFGAKINPFRSKVQTVS